MVYFKPPPDVEYVTINVLNVELEDYLCLYDFLIIFDGYDTGMYWKSFVGNVYVR